VITPCSTTPARRKVLNFALCGNSSRPVVGGVSCPTIMVHDLKMDAAARSMAKEAPLDTLSETGTAPHSSVNAVVDSLRKQSNGAKLTGYICVGITLLIGAAILVTFLFFSQISAAQRSEREKMLLEIRYEQQRGLLAKIGESVAADQIKATLNALIDNANRPQATSVESPLESIVYETTSSVIRVGAVLVGIFLIQIMVTFTRYYFKLASHLSMASALISLSNGKLADLKSTAPLFMPSRIEFGKEPTSPAEKVLDGAVSAIRELSRKIPTR